MLNTGSSLKRVLMTSHPLQKAAQPPKASEKDHLCSAALSPRMTDASPALLLLLSLGLCCPGAQSQKYVTVPKFYDSKITHPQRGKPLKLECTSSADSGVSWIRQDKAGTLHFIVYISTLSKATFEGSQKTSSRFQVSKSGTSYQLQVNSFEARDEGIYFCTINFNQALYFSSGLRVFFPVTTTAAPVTTVSTTQSTQVTKRNVCLQSHGAETSKEKELNFFCEIFIWVPLAAACILLLIALVITIVLCQKTRRRRCRCKRLVLGSW
ncbi:T-cell surface glycoprotein CD8 alpha chain isoform X1 [Cygnus olor]|uniref:T-cell surface glycoprotein CD8 alpha chain isoform X1 n=1 Tax=Cygnus olor TaxID=8869 RepID=UPI001ADDF86F|nr:T-cell surface glycoprotein CD8 alpha chain isoform X1 [Cygnus olor]